MSSSPQRTALGIAIGPSVTRLGVADTRSGLHVLAEVATPVEGDPILLAEEISRAAAKVVAKDHPTIETAGIALPGVWERSTGVMLRAPRLPLLSGVNLPDLFARALRRPTFIDSIANAAGWAQWQTLNPLPQRFVYLSLDDGVAGCAILDGAIVRHTHGGAGEFGALIVDTSPDAPVGRNGVRGCLEAVVAAAEIDSAENGDTAVAMNTPLVNALTLAVFQIAHLYMPAVVAFGGRIVDDRPGLTQCVQSAFKVLSAPALADWLTVRDAPLSTSAAAVTGAALLALAA
ncbi:MAG: ROK family protein [Planctomycetes bacterium]|nr:ROK family protein [Planctomycetota bacterium]